MASSYSIVIFLVVSLYILVGRGEIVSLPFLDLGNSYINLSNDDDISSPGVELPSAILLGDSSENTAFISSNGVISFGSNFTEYITRPFPIDDLVVAPYWDDIDLEITGEVRYSLLSDVESSLLQQVNYFLENNQSLEFNASWILIAQWIDTCPYENNTCKSEMPNTFQAVIATDGEISVAIFTYLCGSLNWIKSEAGAVVGYSLNGSFFQEHPSSRESHVNNLDCLNQPLSNWTNLVYIINNITVPITIEDQSNDVISQESESIELSCSIQGYPPIDVAWKKDGTYLSSDINTITIVNGLVTQSILTIDDLGFNDEGVYVCVATNKERMIESSGISLTVNLPVVLTQTPISTEVSEGERATFTCIAVGRPLPMITWNGPQGEINEDDESIEISTLKLVPSNAFLSVLSLEHVSFFDTGVYNCTASNSAHGDLVPLDVETHMFSVTVLTLPILEYITPDNIIVILGDTVSLEFIITRAVPAVTPSGVEWTFQSGGIQQSVQCLLQNVDSCQLSENHLKLTLFNVTLWTQGNYTIRVTNEIGSVFKTVSVIIEDPAAISKAPLNVNTTEGSTVSVVCRAHGIPSPSIHWYKNDNGQIQLAEDVHSTLFINTTELHIAENGTNIVESVLEFSTVMSINRGEYLCVTYNDVDIMKNGSFNVSNFSVTVQTYPVVDFSIISWALTESETMLQCKVSGYPLPSFVWLKNGKLLEVSPKIHINHSVVNSTTISTFVILPELEISDSGTYSCVGVTELVESLYTNVTGNLAVFEQVNILTTESSYTLNESSSLQLSCSATGFPLPDIQWQKSNTNEDTDEDIRSSHLPLNNTITSNIILGADGVYTVTSLLHVSELLYSDRGEYICSVINIIPDIGYVLSNGSVAFNVTVQTPPELSPFSNSETIGILNNSISLQFIITRDHPTVELSNILWFFNGEQLNTTGERYYFSDNKLVLYISALQFEDEGDYTLLVSNDAGISEASINLDVQAPPQVTDITDSISLLEHEDIEFVCTVISDPIFDVSWYYNDIMIHNSTHYLIAMSLSMSSLKIINATLQDAGEYKCVVSNIHGNDVAQSLLEIQVPPVFVIHPTNTTGIAGSSVNLDCISTGNPKPNIVWYKNNKTLPQETLSFIDEISVRSNLHLESLSLSDEGVYRCEASNFLSVLSVTQSDTGSLKIQFPPNITTTEKQVTVNESSLAILHCIGLGNPLPQLLWRRLSGSELPYDAEVTVTIETHNETGAKYLLSTLTLPNVSSSTVDAYLCEGTNNVTNIILTPESIEIQLVVQTLPLLTLITSSGAPFVTATHSRLSNTPQQASLKFRIERAYPSVKPQDIHWTRNTFDTNAPVLLANSNHYILNNQLNDSFIELVIRNIQYSDQGLYTVVVSNAAGITTSSVDLFVNVEVDLFHEGSISQTIEEHQSVTFTCIADGIPTPNNLRWFRNGTLINTDLFQRFDISESEVTGIRVNISSDIRGLRSTLTVTDLLASIDNGFYNCRASNDVGLPAILSAPFQLDVTKSPSQEFCANEPCKNGGTCMETRDNYYCLCSFDYAGRNCEEDVLYEIPPSITSPPKNTTSALYSEVSLSCQVTGNPTPRVTWFKDGQEIFTDIYTLTINELGLKERGFYHCEATSRVDGEITTVVSEVAIVNIEGIVQYEASLQITESSETPLTLDSIQKLVDEINEFVAGSIIQGDTSLFFIELFDSQNINLAANSIPVVITIITEEGGSDDLLLAVQDGLGSLSVGLQSNVSFLVSDRFDGCRPETTLLTSQSGDPSLDIYLQWPEINIGVEAVVKCPCGGVDIGSGNLEARRYCGGNFTKGAKWEIPYVAQCDFSDRARKICNLAELPSSEKLEKLGDIIETQTDFVATEISVAASVLLTTREDASGNRTLTEGYFDVVDNINQIPMNTLQESLEQANTSARLLESVQKLIENVPISENETTTVLNKATFAVAVQEMDLTQSDQGIYFTFNELVNEDNIDDNNTLIQIKLPKEIARFTENRTKATLAYALHKNESLFLRRRTNNLEINSPYIVSASVAGVSVNNLSDLIELTIPSQFHSFNKDRERCYFWDSSLNDGFGDWSQENCDTIYSSNGSVTCRCNHLTNFAVLLDVSPEPADNNLNTGVGKALNAISYIGVIVSIVSLLVTVTTYLASRKLRRSDHGQLLMNLCFALLGLYIVFILALHGTAVPGLCAVFSALLQYFLLVTFFAMAAEALNLYIKLVIVLGKGIQKYVIKATLVSWVIPVFIVLFCFAPSYKFYIGKHFCRVFDIPFYVGVLVPFIIIYIFNWGLFVIIMTKLLTKACQKKFKESYSDEQKVSLRQQFLIALTLSILFGLGWGIGLLATQELHETAVRDTFAALFIILTAFQGLFIFVMHCIRSKEVRKEWTRWVYKIRGKQYLDYSSSMANSVIKKRSQFRGQQSNVTNTSYVSNIGSRIYGEEKLKTIASLEKELEATGNIERIPSRLGSDISDDSSNEPLPDYNSAIVYRVPSGLDLSKFDDNRFSYISTTSHGSDCKSIENPLRWSETQRVPIDDMEIETQFTKNCNVQSTENNFEQVNGVDQNLQELQTIEQVNGVDQNLQELQTTTQQVNGIHQYSNNVQLVGKEVDHVVKRKLLCKKDSTPCSSLPNPMLDMDTNSGMINEEFV